MKKEAARKIVQEYLDKYGEIPSVFSDLRLAEAIITLEDELEEIINEQR